MSFEFVIPFVMGVIVGGISVFVSQVAFRKLKDIKLVKIVEVPKQQTIVEAIKDGKKM